MFFTCGDGTLLPGSSVCNKKAECADGSDEMCGFTCLPPECAPGCTYQKHGNGWCNRECANPACAWDNGDCECAPGPQAAPQPSLGPNASASAGGQHRCFWWNIGDGVCDPQCLAVAGMPKGGRCLEDAGDCAGSMNRARMQNTGGGVHE